MRTCAEKGQVSLACGIRGNVIRFPSPLRATDEIVGGGLDILETALRDLTMTR